MVLYQRLITGRFTATRPVACGLPAGVILIGASRGSRKVRCPYSSTALGWAMPGGALVIAVVGGACDRSAILCPRRSDQPDDGGDTFRADNWADALPEGGSADGRPVEQRQFR